MRKYLKDDERGLTLIELLATIVIGSIVIGLATGVLVSAMKQNKMVTEHNALRQEANLIITKLRQIHQEEPYTLCFNEDKKLYINGSSLGTDTYTYSAVSVENVNGELTTGSLGCIHDIDVNSPLLVEFTLEDKEGHQFNLNTAIQRIKPVERSEGEVVGDIPWENREEFSALNPSHLTVNNTNNNPSNCNFASTTLNQKVSGTFPINSGNCSSVTFKTLLLDGVTFPAGSNITINQILYSYINKSTIIQDGWSIQNATNLRVNQQARFDGKLDLGQYTSFYVDNNLHTKKEFTVKTKSDVFIGKDANFEQGVSLTGDSDVFITGNLFANGTINVGPQAELYILGNLYLGDNIIINGSENICVEGAVSYKSPASPKYSFSCEN
ncbi:prepilin-type N-terminal cleavage/methylation domain-containing protein [Sutcliffiella horikoshii]|uniref:prepilin-type N-terminal cleavage/methylation domain-containing protein n=1 Tax=Sutcliffiella horikoshii TaxID=79883 RepID=UPI001F4251BB|nr:prepilin-type N-terminal cleavage/methylation domain-containing protein [Sutcliffiella horikoshii]MCG1022198.1 prepilin-type N-terminal cleavage/methylation domain-containing protein [Sutcliffiella horikoshii]